MKRFYTTLMSVFLAMLLLGGSLFAAEYQVKQDGSGDFTAIQEAIDAAATGDVIIVHPGTFYENIHFLGKNIVLTSTDIWDRDVVEATIIDGQQLGSVVTFAGTENESCELSGFTITNGEADCGAGILAESWDDVEFFQAAASISHCFITSNTAAAGDLTRGTGAGVRGLKGRISRCIIAENCVGRSGGGMYRCNGSYVDRCIITGNSAGSAGGGLGYCDGITMVNCVVSSNSGGGVSSCGGTMRSCIIESNTGARGAGLSCWSGTIADCIIRNNSSSGDAGGVNYCLGIIVDTVIMGNHAEGYGGAFYADGAHTQSLLNNCLIVGNSATNGGAFAEWVGHIINCTIVGNLAEERAGALYLSEWAMISDSIVWGNESADDEQIYNYFWYVEPTYSCIQDWDEGGEGNISDDPLFVTGPDGDYYLSSKFAGQDADSPCIDAGSDLAWRLGLWDRTTRTDAAADEGAVDMGYHYAGVPETSKPKIECILGLRDYIAGNYYIKPWVEIQNPGEDRTVDIYVGFVRPDGSISTATPRGFVLGLAPYVSGLFLPRGFSFGPNLTWIQLTTGVSWVRVPSNAPTGDWLFAGAIAPAEEPLSEFLAFHATPFTVREPEMRNQ
ncbi:MAG TPA: hypothetical protein VM163_07935 [bacterium]|nr:hypothetical protein [bacterium]